MMTRDWGRHTLMGDPRQRRAEEIWRYQIGALRGDILASDFGSPMSGVIGEIPVFRDEDIDVIEAALDGCSQEDIARFIYILLAARNRR